MTIPPRSSCRPSWTPDDDHRTGTYANRPASDRDGPDDAEFDIEDLPANAADKKSDIFERGNVGITTRFIDSGSHENVQVVPRMIHRKHMISMSSFHRSHGNTHWLHKWLPRNPAACPVRGLLPIVMASSWIVAGAQTTPPAIKGVALPGTPLYAAVPQEKPALVIAVHVDSKSSEALYTIPGEVDDSYTTAKEYLGYHDAESCYRYNDAPTETPATGLTRTDYKRFDRTGPATHRQCDNAFSGNFLNWATGATTDMLRLTLTGGDRHIDTPSLTILQRAMLSIGSGSRASCDWSHNIFLAKRLHKDGGGDNLYWGAIPASMITAAYGNDIFVSNMRDRIYFGLSRTVSCNGGAFEQALGHPVRSIGMVRNAPQPAPPTTAVRCATEGRICSFSGIKDVWYGRGTHWKVATASVGIQCTGNVFGQTGASANECRATAPAEAWMPPNSYSRPVSDVTGVLPPGAVRCAGEGQTCSFSGRREIWYGTGDSWRVAPASDGIHCSHTVFGGRTEEVLKSCHHANYTGPWTPPASPPRPTVSTEYLNSDGYFYARVNVCDINIITGALQDIRDYGLCHRYPRGNYKPTGIIQKYGDQLRLAAFGYLLDDGNGASGRRRYGGVLRVPMKYVGNKTYDSNGLDNTPAGGNPAAEWDISTGVLHANPRDDASAPPPANTRSTNHGIINFLNKSGRVSPEPGPTEERYRNEGPAGELHYEAVRYLQGLAPSPAAIRGTITARMADGFPYYTTWSDPYGDGRSRDRDYSCVKSNILIFGGNPASINHDGILPVPNDAENIPDIHHWGKTVLDFERNIGGKYIDGNGEIRTISNPNPPAFQQADAADRNGIDTLLGSAYWARTHDIRGTGWTGIGGIDKQRPGLRVKTFVLSKDFDNGSLSDASQRRANSFFLTAKYAGFETDPGRRYYNSNGNPFMDQHGNSNNDVWQKPDEPGEAGTFHYSDPTKTSPARGMLSALDDIFKDAAMHSLAGSSLSTGRQFTAGAIRYSATFDVDNWRGDVVAEPVIRNANRALVTGTPRWSAARQLKIRPSTWARRILIGKPGINFAAVDLGSAMIDETVKTKIRNSPLGVIVNSNVVYSGAPGRKPFTTGAGYAAFRAANASRTPAVFAGANDGMLHAFDAATGDELFAYIPSWIGRVLTGPSLVAPQGHVDAPMVVAEAQVGRTDIVATDWKTVLVSGTGGGGSGVFALDVSNPSSFGATNVMWEFTRTDDPDIGQVVGAPKIMKIKTSAPNAVETYRWFAVVAGGVNNHLRDSTDPAQPVSSHGNPALFLLALDKPAGSPWVRGSNYFKITVPHTAPVQTHAPGLANFSALYGIRGEMTDIYMGDLHGALWRLQFQGKATADWTMDKLSFFYRGTRENPRAYPLYRARFRPANDASSGQVQPIFAAPTLFAGPKLGNVNTYYVMFGTGKYLEPMDKLSTTRQTVYIIYDNGAAAQASADPAVAGIIPGRGRLQAAAIDADRNVTAPNFRWGRPVSDTDTIQRAGWYFDLPESGERIHHAALNLGSLTAAINSTIPIGRPHGGVAPCHGPGGGNEYKLNVVNGTGSHAPFTGLPATPLFMIDDTLMPPSNSAGQRMQTIVLRPLAKTQHGNNDSSTGIEISRLVGRLSWRQIFNYRDINQAP